MSEAQETSDYPGALDTWTTITDKEDLAEQSDINKIKAGVEAVQTELGTDPAGSTTDLTTRLSVALADSGAVAQGTSDPVSPTPVIGQMFYRTDTDQFKIYDGSTWDVIGPSGSSVKSVTTLSGVATSSDIVIEPSKHYKVVFDFTNDATTSTIAMRFNSSAGSSDYAYINDKVIMGTSPTSTLTGDDANTSLRICSTLAASSYVSGSFMMDTFKKDSRSAFINGKCTFDDGTNHVMCDFSGVMLTDVTIADFEFVTTGAAVLTGTVYLYELALTA